MDLLTASQVLKLKGGHVSVTLRDRRAVISVQVGHEQFRGVTDLSLKGYQTLTDVCGTVMGCKLRDVTPGSCGVNYAYLQCLSGKGGPVEVLKDIAREMAGERDGMCKSGFFHETAEIGTIVDLAQRNKLKSYQAIDESEKEAMTGMARAWGYRHEWDGLKMVLVDEDVEDCMCEMSLVRLFKRFEEMPWDPPKSEVKGVKFDVVLEMDDRELASKFLERCDVPYNALPYVDQERVFWGGGRAQKSKRSIASEIFPRVEMGIAEFMAAAKKRCVEEWDYAEKNKVIGARSVEAFVFGQMLRCRAQLVVNKSAKTVRYDPTPEEYVRSQKNGQDE